MIAHRYFLIFAQRLQDLHSYPFEELIQAILQYVHQFDYQNQNLKHQFVIQVELTVFYPWLALIMDELTEQMD